MSVFVLLKLRGRGKVTGNKAVAQLRHFLVEVADDKGDFSSKLVLESVQRCRWVT
jgi:hypothetical protein